MPYDLAIEQKPGYLHVRVSGDNSPETVLAYLAEVRAACEERRCPNVLIEENLSGRGLDSFDVFRIAAEGSRRTSPAVGRIAYVDTNPAHEPRLMKFAETVAVNRGLNVRVFGSVEVAEGWIGG